MDVQFIKLTKAEYQNIQRKNSKTFYYLTDTKDLFQGNKLMSYKQWHGTRAEFNAAIIADTLFPGTIITIDDEEVGGDPIIINAPYKVEHYQMNLEGEYDENPTETDNLTGHFGTKVTPATVSYTGFTAPATQEITISPDGDSVVKYYYVRNKYTQITRARYQNANGTYGEYFVADTAEVYYGDSYSWERIAQTTDGVPYQAASVSSYVVTENQTNSVDIDRETYTLNLSAGSGINRVSGGGTYRYGETVEINATPESDYNFVNWSGSDNISNQSTTIVIDGDKTLTANGEIAYPSVTFRFIKGEYGVATPEITKVETYVPNSPTPKYIYNNPGVSTTMTGFNNGRVVLFNHERVSWTQLKYEDHGIVEELTPDVYPDGYYPGAEKTENVHFIVPNNATGLASIAISDRTTNKNIEQVNSTSWAQNIDIVWGKGD